MQGMQFAIIAKFLPCGSSASGETFQLPNNFTKSAPPPPPPPMGKLKSRWIGPFIIHQAYPNGLVDLLNQKDNRVFKVNGQRVKPYAAQHTANEEEIPLLDPP